MVKIDGVVLDGELVELSPYGKLIVGLQDKLRGEFSPELLW